MSLFFPGEPALPGLQRTTGRTHLRYEDVCQDGRAMLHALPHSVGLVWRNLLADGAVARLSRDGGVVPILTRLVLGGSQGTVAVANPLQVSGSYQLAGTRDDAGDVDRLVLLMWTGLKGPMGRTYARRPPGASRIVEVGRVFADHVFTRPFAEPGQRKVLRFSDRELPDVPDRIYHWRPPHAAMALPDGAVMVDEDLQLDAAPIVFGLNHTDSNQHVNSLVYPRVFEQACLRRFAELGRDARLLSRYAEIAYRKPCFAGEQVRVVVRAFELDGKLGAAGCFVPASDRRWSIAEAERMGHCFVRMLFTPPRPE